MGAVLFTCAALVTVPASATEPAGGTWLATAHWVVAEYPRLTDAQADPSTVAIYSYFVRDGIATLPQAAAAMERSTGGRTHLVNRAYQEALGRTADPGGLQYWSGWLSDQSNGLHGLLSNLYGSLEWFRGPGGNSNVSYVAALYQHILHRDAHQDPYGWLFWTYQLNSGMPIAELPWQLLGSQEGRYDRVQVAYDTALGRDPDAGGWAFWTGALASADDIDLIAVLAASDEVVAGAAGTRLPPGMAVPEGNGDCGVAAPTTAAGWQAAFAALHTPGWSGADDNASVSIGNGRELFVSGDTYQGPLDPDGGRPADHGFVHNSAVLAEGDCLIPMTGPNDGPLLPDLYNGDYYWPDTPFTDAGQVWVFLGRMRTVDPTTPFGFAQQGIDVAQFGFAPGGIPSLVALDTTPASSDAQTSWGAAVTSDADDVYIYGTRQDGFGKDLFVARTPHGSIGTASAWQFWNGSGWSSSIGAATPVLRPSATLSVGTQGTVWPHSGGGWNLVSKNFDAIGNGIAEWTAPTPEGPWTPSGDAIALPVEKNSAGHSLATYGVSVHLGLPLASGKLLVSYNQTDLTPVAGDRDVAPYMVHFLELPEPTGPTT